MDVRRIVFVDGVFVPELSDLQNLSPGLTIRPMAQALASGDPLVAAHLGKVVATEREGVVSLNTALMRDGALIHVAKGATVEHPVHLVFAATGDKPASVFTRSLVVVEEGARAMVVESHDAAAGHQVNTAIELIVGDKAHVDHIKITAGPADLVHISSLMAAVGAHARLNDFAFNIGGGMVRNQLFVRFDGEGTVASLRGASLLKGKQHADTTLVADHKAQRLPEPRGVRLRARRRKPRRVPGQDHRASACAEDRRQDDDALAAAVGNRRGRQQAGARDFRRRRAVRPRRDGGRARRGSEVLPDGARHSRKSRPRRCWCRPSSARRSKASSMPVCATH